ncbi:uncharacterized protein [Magallana gigas]|uniref:uncharacterized protein isoform X2 n=1 Tax=Magallana gigas TaxID=29159 RepID=UPI00334148E5
MFATYHTHKASTFQEKQQQIRERAKLENWPPKDDDDEEDLKQREEQSESKLFLSVDEKMKTEEGKEGMEQPGADHASSPSPFPEEIGNPAGCVRRTLALVESLS